MDWSDTKRILSKLLEGSALINKRKSQWNLIEAMIQKINIMCGFFRLKTIFIPKITIFDFHMICGKSYLNHFYEIFYYLEIHTR
jgi:hypothetical protein